MRTTFLRGAEALFFTLVIFIITAGITGVMSRTPKTPEKPQALMEWDAKDAQQKYQAANPPSGPSPAELTDIGFQPPPDGTPVPAGTNNYNTKAANLLNLLHNYYFTDDEKMLTESVEFIDRYTGYRKPGFISDSNYQLDTVGKNVKYLLALAKFKKLHATMPVFDQDLARMDAIVRTTFETHPVGTHYGEETFFDLLELASITGDNRYRDYADYIDQVGNLATVAQGHALMEQAKAPRSLSPKFMNSVVLLQYYSTKRDPLLIQAARTLYDGIINASYAPNFKLFYTMATYQQASDQGLNAVTTFKTVEQGTALLRMMDYYDATHNQDVLDKISEIMDGMMTGQIGIGDIDNGLFYSKYLDKSTEYRNEEKRADVNLIMYAALFRYLRYNEQYFDQVSSMSVFFDQKIYDETYNGFYTHYTPSWDAAAVDGIYELSLTEAILGAQVFLNNEETMSMIRQTPATGN